MKKQGFIALIALALTMSGCELVGDIFEAGVWAGIVLVLVVIGVVIFILAKLFGK